MVVLCRSYFTKEIIRAIRSNEKSFDPAAWKAYREYHSARLEKINSLLNGAGVHVLHLLGFGSSGIAAGSIAAGLQTSHTVAGGLFALAQSAGATGASSTMAATTGGVAMSLLGGVAWLGKRILRCVKRR